MFYGPAPNAYAAGPTVTTAAQLRDAFINATDGGSVTLGGDITVDGLTLATGISFPSISTATRSSSTRQVTTAVLAVTGVPPTAPAAPAPTARWEPTAATARPV